MADQISDAVLDALIEQDKGSRVGNLIRHLIGVALRYRLGGE
jgi:S-adenosylmethionine synthetase